MRNFLFALFCLFVVGIQQGSAQQATSVSEGVVPVECVFINGTSKYTYVLSSMRQSCTGGSGCIGGMVGFGYLKGSGFPLSKCDGSFTSECKNVSANTTAGCAANCACNCSGSCSGSDCNCATYSLGCPDSCVTSLAYQSSSSEFGEQNLVFNVPGARLVLVYDVYATASSAYLTTIPVAFSYSANGTTLTAAIPTTTGFSIASEDTSSSSSVTVDISPTSVPEITLRYDPS